MIRGDLDAFSGARKRTWDWARSRNFACLLKQKFLECVEVLSSQRSDMATERTNERHNGSKRAKNCGLRSVISAMGGYCTAADSAPCH